MFLEAQGELKKAWWSDKKTSEESPEAHSEAKNTYLVGLRAVGLRAGGFFTDGVIEA